MLEVKPPPVPEPAHSDPRMGMSITEAASRTGVSAHTLRYYERAGLVVTTIDRTASGRRRCHQLTWIGSPSAPGCEPPACPSIPSDATAQLVSAGPGNDLPSWKYTASKSPPN